MHDSETPAANAQRMCGFLAHAPIIPVLTISRLAQAVPLAEAVAKTGLGTLEVTLRTDCAFDAMQSIREAFPDLKVGGGTVTSPRHLDQLKMVQADFAVSPGLTLDLLRHAKSIDMPYLPGIASVSELMLGFAEGYRCFKFFPAQASGGVKTLQSFAGPFGDVKFFPTGGIHAENFTDFLGLKNVASVGGSWLAPEELVEAEDWRGIETLCRTAKERLRQLQQELRSKGDS